MHRFFLRLSKGMAILGGIALSVIVGVVVLSILGRELNAFLHGDFAQGAFRPAADRLLAVRLPGLWGDIRLGPVNGDYEIVEAGVAFAVFAFLPLAQITGAHATVDVFTNFLSERANRVLAAVAEVLFALVLVIIAVQLWHGTYAKFSRGQTTFLLQFPLWWAYAFSLFGAVLAAIVALYVAAERLVEMVVGRKVGAVGEEAQG